MTTDCSFPFRITLYLTDLYVPLYLNNLTEIGKKFNREINKIVLNKR